jgi:hypothetical protein
MGKGKKAPTMLLLLHCPFSGMGVDKIRFIQ